MLLALTVLLVASYPGSATNIVYAAVLPIALLISAIGQLQPHPDLGELPFVCQCCSLTRGTGDLRLERDGSIHFFSRPTSLDLLHPGDQSTWQRVSSLGGHAARMMLLLVVMIGVPVSLLIGLAELTNLSAAMAVLIAYGAPLIPALLVWRLWRKRSQLIPKPILDTSLRVPENQLLAVLPIGGSC